MYGQIITVVENLKTLYHLLLHQKTILLLRDTYTHGANIYYTSNATSITEVKAQAHVFCQYVAPPGKCYYNTLLCCDYFSSLSVVSHAFSVPRVYSKFGHHPHLLGYLCAKVCFLCGLHCWASVCRRNHVLNQSLNDPAYLHFGKYYRQILNHLIGINILTVGVLLIDRKGHNFWHWVRPSKYVTQSVTHGQWKQDGLINH